MSDEVISDGETSDQHYGTGYTHQNGHSIDIISLKSIISTEIEPNTCTQRKGTPQQICKLFRQFSINFQKCFE